MARLLTRSLGLPDGGQTGSTHNYQQPQILPPDHAPELLCDLPGDLFPNLVHVLIHHHLNDIRYLPNNLPVLLSSQPPTPILILLPNHVFDFLREFPGDISMEKS